MAKNGKTKLPEPRFDYGARCLHQGKVVTVAGRACGYAAGHHPHATEGPDGKDVQHPGTLEWRYLCTPQGVAPPFPFVSVLWIAEADLQSVEQHTAEIAAAVKE